MHWQVAKVQYTKPVNEVWIHGKNLWVKNRAQKPQLASLYEWVPALKVVWGRNPEILFMRNPEPSRIGSESKKPLQWWWFKILCKGLLESSWAGGKESANEFLVLKTWNLPSRWESKYIYHLNYLHLQLFALKMPLPEMISFSSCTWNFHGKWTQFYLDYSFKRHTYYFSQSCEIGSLHTHFIIT